MIKVMYLSVGFDGSIMTNTIEEVDYIYNPDRNTFVSNNSNVRSMEYRKETIVVNHNLVNGYHVSYAYDRDISEYELKEIRVKMAKELMQYYIEERDTYVRCNNLKIDKLNEFKGEETA